MAGKGNGGQAGDAPASPPAGLGGGGAPVAVVVGVHEEVPPQEENPVLPAPVVDEDVGLLQAVAPEDQENDPDGDEGAGALNVHLQELEAKLDAPEPSNMTTQELEGSSILREMELELEGSSILREMELASGLPNPNPNKPRLDPTLRPPSGKATALPFGTNYAPAVGGGSGGAVVMDADAGMGPAPQFPIIIPPPPPLGPILLCPAGCGRTAVTNTIGSSMQPPIVLPPHPCLCDPCYTGAPHRWDTDCAVCRYFYRAYPGKQRRIARIQ